MKYILHVETLPEQVVPAEGMAAMLVVDGIVNAVVKVTDLERVEEND